MWNDGKMDGFVKNAIAHSVTPTGAPAATDGAFVLTYRERTDLPFYHWLADNWALADHYFSSTLSGTWANRLYLYAGSSYGVKNTGTDYLVKADTPTIFSALDAAKVTWQVYSDDSYPLDGSLISAGWDATHKGVSKTAAFYAALADGTLPQVTFIDAGLNIEDEHPPADVQLGEAYSKKVYDAVTSSPLWLKDGKGIAFIWTYDESGGFFEHLPPPKACLASPDQAEFDRLGFRVPFVLVSPFARRKYVSHQLHSHTSVLRFIELLHDLPALTARDANSDALLDMFDFGCPPPAKAEGAPAAGSGGCKK
jgi:phospholipase C